jgi:mono/diheme cytochrome c family protein
MAEVVRNLSSVDEKDVHAIAVYMTSVFGPPTPDHIRRGDEVLAQIKSPTVPSGPTETAGAAIYAAACATCHETGRALPYGGVNLGLSTAISGPDPRNAINIILSGIRPVEGERSPIMPGFANAMTDDQVSAVLNYLRSRFSNQPAWTGVEKTIEDARRTQTVSLQTPPPRNVPADPMQRDKP